ncbi:MAG TPA: hypothetical protein VFL10_07850 [Ornithinibacter sp.]|nr:hypothetical protein [Ornithinibacter sp.]
MGGFWGVCVVSVLAVAGCAASPPAALQQSSSVAATSTASASAAAPAPKCQRPTAEALAAVNATITDDAKGNSLPEAVVLADPDSGMWFVAGAFAGPAAKGEGALGIWATTTDPTQGSFTGKVLGVDGGASTWSKAPMTEATSYDPANVPVLGCWPPAR